MRTSDSIEIKGDTAIDIDVGCTCPALMVVASSGRKAAPWWIIVTSSAVAVSPHAGVAAGSEGGTVRDVVARGWDRRWHGR